MNDCRVSGGECIDCGLLCYSKQRTNPSTETVTVKDNWNSNPCGDCRMCGKKTCTTIFIVNERVLFVIRLTTS